MEKKSTRCNLLESCYSPGKEDVYYPHSKRVFRNPRVDSNQRDSKRGGRIPSS